MEQNDLSKRWFSFFVKISILVVYGVLKKHKYVLVKTSL